MPQAISYRRNQDLLRRRTDTVLRDGVGTTADVEEGVLKAQGPSNFMGIVPLRCKLGNFHMLHLGDDHVAERLLWFGCFGYERCTAAIFTHLAHRAGLVLDLGVYTGYFTLLSSILAGNSATFGVEANPLNFHRVKENLRINGSSATVANYAVVPEGESHDTIDLCYNANLHVLDAGGFADHSMTEEMSFKQAKEDRFIVPTRTLRALLEGWNVDPDRLDGAPVVAKVDIEGLEAPLLREIVELFDRASLCIVVEILSAEVYASIYALTDRYPELALGFIDEYRQVVIAQHEPDFQRTLGSRNFVLASQQILDDIVGETPQDLLASYE